MDQIMPEKNDPMVNEAFRSGKVGAEMVAGGVVAGIQTSRLARPWPWPKI